MPTSHYIDSTKLIWEQAHQHGIWTHFERMENYLAGVRTELKDVVETNQPISMKNVLFIFVIYGIGKSVAFMIFILELLLGLKKRVLN